ncbi:MAG: glycosyltransferase family 4 protein [Elusimicrobia bacterium]|nr:glycosyltransferase family 4 protein [Elusimicrobiota bacterium]
MAGKTLIIHIITRLEPGGPARNVIDSAIYQAKDRDVLLAAGPCSAALELPENVQYLELPDLKRGISPLSDLKVYFGLKRIFLRLKPGIIHTHAAKAGFLGRLAARAYNRSVKSGKALVIHTPHGHLLYGCFGHFKIFIFKLSERLAARWTDRFIALTPGELEESVAAGLGARKKWTVIHSGVRFTPMGSERASIRKEMGLSADETVMGVAARLEPVKGVEYFIRAAKLISDKAENKKLRFIVVGDGGLATELRTLARQLALGEKINFTGFQKDISRYLCVMDIYVQPSLNEAMGRTILEAQYARLPVIASKVCGLPYAVKDGVTGILVPPADPGAIAGAAEPLLNNEAKRRAMGEAARRWVLQKDYTGYPQFSVEAMNISLKSLYNKVLDGGKS